MFISLEYKSKTFAGIDVNDSDSLSVLIDYKIPQNIIDDAVVAAKIEAVKTARKKAYIEESDPLFLEWQYDQSAEKEQAWRDKVAEIKMRYPLPTAQ